MWLYHVFSLSLRDVELILAERGIVVTHPALVPEVRCQLRRTATPTTTEAWRHLAPW
jgi:transposase-like protein